MTRVVRNLLLMSVFLYAWLIHDFFHDFYVQSVQEDEYLEWATFFGFVLATVLFAIAGYDRQKKHRGKKNSDKTPLTIATFPWFLYGLSIFCFIFAMEEISWGQRILAYQPPTYFLKENFQQELNFHNVIGTSIRKLTLQVIILGYGVILPLMMLVPYVKQWGIRLGIIVPSVWLAPSMLINYIFAVWYPWRYTGELVELVLAFVYIFMALDENWKNGVRFGAKKQTGDEAPLKQIALAWVLILAIGIGGAILSRIARSADEDLITMAEAEVIAITRDFVRLYREHRKEFILSCRLHKRVYTYIEAFNAVHLRQGEYVALTQQGLPQERADYFIDPWNAPYWIRLRCTRVPGSQNVKKIHVYVYSFGPNRRRESTDSEILPDDIGKQFGIEF